MWWRFRPKSVLVFIAILEVKERHMVYASLQERVRGDVGKTSVVVMLCIVPRNSRTDDACLAKRNNAAAQVFKNDCALLVFHNHKSSILWLTPIGISGTNFRHFVPRSSVPSLRRHKLAAALQAALWFVYIQYAPTLWTTPYAGCAVLYVDRGLISRLFSAGGRVQDMADTLSRTV